MAAIPNSYRLEGSRLAPTGIEWTLAPSSLKRLYWKKFGEFAAKEKDADLAAGLDKRGARMPDIADSTREARLNPAYSPMGIADPNAPPLTPCYGLSRTRSLLRHQSDENGVTFYWDFDPNTGDSWGVVLSYHAKADGGRPARDVFGLSPNGTNRARAAAIRWWNGYLSSRLAANVRVTQREAQAPVAPAPGPYQPPRTKRAPVAPYYTGPQLLINGKFVNQNIPNPIYTPMYGVGTRGR